VGEGAAHGIAHRRLREDHLPMLPPRQLGAHRALSTHRVTEAKYV